MRANILHRRRFAMVAGGAAIGLFLAVFLGSQAIAQDAPLAMPAPMTARDLFVAVAVKVDVTAGTVTEARERALTQGRVAGFRQVVERVVAREDLAKVPQLTATQIIDMVREFSIANERSSAVRYLGDLTVRFDPAAVRRVLRNAGVPFTEIISKPLVVVPLTREGALWEATNAWFGAWLRSPPVPGLVPLIVPTGDAQDIATLSFAQAAGKDSAALAAFAERYRAAGALVAILSPGGQVAMTVYRTGQGTEELSASYGGEAGQTQDEILAAAAEAASVAVQETWKRRNRIVFGESGQVTALVPVASVRQWTSMRGRLDDVALINRIDLQAITRDRAQVTLYYAGAQDQLELAMAQHDLKLVQQDGVWIIQDASVVLRQPPVAEAPAEAPAESRPQQ